MKKIFENFILTINNLFKIHFFFNYIFLRLPFFLLKKIKNFCLNIFFQILNYFGFVLLKEQKKELYFTFFFYCFIFFLIFFYYVVLLNFFF